jgi:peptide/nickel transport system substrate-binding protein
MMNPQLSAMLIAGTLLVCWGCAPAASPGGRSDPGATSPPAAPTPKTLTIAIETEPLNVIAQIGGATGTRGGTQIHMAVHQRLVSYDNRGEVRPMLASEVPSQERGTWVIRPDGTMQTTYRLRQNVTWHDGERLTARDFVFGWTVQRDRDIGTNNHQIADQILSIDTPDEYTLVMEWSNPYPFAHAIAEEDLGPYPMHILSTTYPSDKERFQQLTYWTRDFVGVGPYTVGEWENGSYLTLRAYPGFYAGKAQIDTIIVRFIDNEPTVTANLLAGTIDASIPRAMSFTSAWSVKQQWEQAGKKPVFVGDMTNWRKIFVQFRPEVVSPREVLDARVRRGLLYGLDRQALVDTLYQGQTVVSHTFIPPDDYRWEWIKDAVTTYEYDPRRAQQVLAEAGWHRAGDGPLLNAAGERVSFPVWTSSAGNNELEVQIIADNWKALGANVETRVLSGAQAQDRELLATFPSFNPSAISLTFQNTLRRVNGQFCPSEQTRWVGSSVGCYQNPEMDRIIDRLFVATDRSEQRDLWRGLMKIQTEDLPVLPLFFEIKASLFREGVTGFRGDTKPSTSATWNVAEWDLK